MSQPIRWDTIMSRSNGESVAGINSAANLLNNGFNQFQGVLKQSEDIQRSNHQNQKGLNTAAFQDAVAKYRSPEELKAAMDNGALDQLRSSLGPNIDANAIRGVADQRMASLMSQKTQEIAFNHVMTDERVAPLLDRFKLAALKGDRAGAEAAEMEYTKLGGRNIAGLAAFSDARQNELTERGQKAGKYDMDIKQGESTITHQRAMEADARARTGIANQELGLNRERVGFEAENMGYAREARLSKAVADNLERMGKFATNSAGSEVGQAKIKEEIDRIKDPDVQTNARRVAQRMSKEKDATVGSVIAALTTVDKRDWFANGDMVYSNSNVVDDAVEVGKNFLKSSAATAYQRRQETGYAAAQKDYETSAARLEAVRKRLDERAGGASGNNSSSSVKDPKVGDRTVSNGFPFVFTADGWTPAHLANKKR